MSMIDGYFLQMMDSHGWWISLLWLMYIGINIRFMYNCEYFIIAVNNEENAPPISTIHPSMTGKFLIS